MSRLSLRERLSRASARRSALCSPVLSSTHGARHSPPPPAASHWENFPHFEKNGSSGIPYFTDTSSLRSSSSSLFSSSPDANPRAQFSQFFTVKNHLEGDFREDFTHNSAIQLNNLVHLGRTFFTWCKNLPPHSSSCGNPCSVIRHLLELTHNFPGWQA